MPSSADTICSTSSSRRAERRSSELFSRFAHQPGRLSSNSGRAVQTSSKGASLAHSSTWSMKSSRLSSAQWRSSKTSTTGRNAASASRKRRQAKKASDRRSCQEPLSLASPTRVRRCPSTHSASGSSRSASRTAPLSFSAAVVADSASRIPACALTIWPSAQKVTPVP